MTAAIPERMAAQPAVPAEANARAATIEALRKQLVRHLPSHSQALSGAAELAVMVTETVADPATDVFWDRADHALAHDLLLTGLAEETVLTTPGRAASEAAGVAVARTLQRQRLPVVAVLDEAGLGTGLAFEAVNHVGHLQVPFVLVLVDAQTPRGRNAGAMARYLTRVRGHARYTDAKNLIETTLGRMPAGEQAVEVARRLKNSVRELLVPTEMWEELLGFMYLGPVDVHNLEALGDLLRLALRVGRPVVLHVTLDGRGPVRSLSSNAATRDVDLERALAASLAGDEQRLLIATDTNGALDTAALAEQAPERYFDLGLGGAHAVAFADSLAAQGYRPIVVLGDASVESALAALTAEPKRRNETVVVISTGRGMALRPPVRAALKAAGFAWHSPDPPNDWAEALRTAGASNRWTFLTPGAMDTD
ncbi:MAG: hypothetical protein OXR64_10920 [Chloroflexota bacterium]|nr:hypothetical protein [Chloroflexota bacterium]MDE2920343.1 hypothetical protein [Chloroflexota bacterium]